MDEVFIKSASVVLLVNGNTPSIFTEKFLSHNKVIPEDLTVEDSILIPPLSQLKYSKGYVFESVDNKIKFERILNEQFSLSEYKKYEDALENSARTLVNCAPYLNYYAIGINFTLVFKELDINNILVNNVDEFETTRLALRKSDATYITNLTFAKLEDNSISLEVNYHHDISGEVVARLNTIIGDRLKFLAKTYSTVEKLLK